LGWVCDQLIAAKRKSREPGEPAIILNSTIKFFILTR